MIPKADPMDFIGRFREIVSDPVNLLLERVPEAGTVIDGHVVLHNGNRVARSGPMAYYDSFSDILVINRGIHEPLEEYVFQEVLRHLPETPVMLELGAYWGHYSMWLKKHRPRAEVYLVEPKSENLDVGRANFALNGYEGHFLQAFVGKDGFQIDAYLQRTGISHLTVLHSDIQGYEVEMLDGASRTLDAGLVDYLFVSTHGQTTHGKVCDQLKAKGYRVEIAADFLYDTTSFDGFVLAVHPDLPPVFTDWAPLGRTAIVQATPRILVESLLPRLTPDKSTQDPAGHWGGPRSI